MKIKDKVFLITGAANGIGRALTIQIIKNGGKVVVTDIDKKGIEKTISLASADSSKTLGIVLDVTNKKEIESLPEKVISNFGQIDCIINNAGIIQPFVPIEELEESKTEQLMNINFYGTYHLTRVFLPYLKKREVANITNICSMGGFIPFPGQSVYGASKAAVKLMTEALYVELLDTNVEVTLIFPGAVRTEIMKNSGLKVIAKNSDMENKSITAENAAQQIVQAIVKGRFKVMVGKDAKMLNFLYRLAPTWASKLIAKQMKVMSN